MSAVIGVSPKHLLTTADWSAAEIRQLFARTAELKLNPSRTDLAGRSLTMIFEKPSTRTRVSFEVGMTQLGGHALYLSSSDLQLSRGETVFDTARVLGRYADAIMARVNRHETLVELSAAAGVPVINGLSDLYHPCQALADFFTVWERIGDPAGKTMAFVGDGDNNVTNSLAVLSAQLGVHFRVAAPPAYAMTEGVLTVARKFAATTGSRIDMMENPREAVMGADIVVTDTWVSMGRDDADSRRTALAPYQLNARLLSDAADGAIVLHCLPAHRGEEITDEIIDGPQSAVWDEAENRLHVQKAVLLAVLG
jgi:ornithine carbamoyltransferase